MAAKDFWGGLIRGGDKNASMAKTMAWLTYTLIVASWFVFPERPIGELIALFVALLGYVSSGKWTWQKYERRRDPDDRQA